MDPVRRTTHPGGGFELMVDAVLCAGACDVCDLFGPLTPERLARIAAEARSAPSLVGRNGYERPSAVEAA